MVGYIPNEIKESDTKEGKEFPYEIGDEADVAIGASCPACGAKWVNKSWSEDGEGYWIFHTDPWGRRFCGRSYDASCDICGYTASIEIKAVVIKQGWS